MPGDNQYADGRGHVGKGTRCYPPDQTPLSPPVAGVQREGGPIEEMHPGDVVWFPAGEKHWHGATPTTAMTDIVIREALDGKVADRMEKLSDEQYRM